MCVCVCVCVCVCLCVCVSTPTGQTMFYLCTYEQVLDLLHLICVVCVVWTYIVVVLELGGWYCDCLVCLSASRSQVDRQVVD